MATSLQTEEKSPPETSRARFNQNNAMIGFGVIGGGTVLELSNPQAAPCVTSSPTLPLDVTKLPNVLFDKTHAAMLEVPAAVLQIQTLCDVLL